MIITNKILNEFKSHLAFEEKSEATVEKYMRDITAFSCYLAGREITKELVMDYKVDIQRRGYAVASINSMLASINSFLKYSDLRNCCVKQLKMQREVFCPKEREMTKAEYVRLVNTAKKKKNERLSALIQTIGSTGIRVSELRFFTVDAVKRGKVIVKCKNKNRVVLVPGSLKMLLLNYAKKTGVTGGEIFVTRSGASLDRSNIWRELKRLCKEAHVDPQKVFPHNLRKLFAKVFYKAEKDIAKLADILGHSNINTTRIYIISSGSEHLRQMEKLGLVV